MPFTSGVYSKFKTFVNGGGLLPTDLNGVQDDLGASLERSLVSIADIKISAVNVVPYGWLICDGSAVSRATYSALFTAVGVTFGAGDGSTTFNIPDLRGKIPVGVSGTIALASTGGEATHTLTAGEMPSHGHSNSYGSTAGGSGAAALSSTADFSNGTAVALNGSSTPHNNMQPYVGMKYLIKF